MRILVLSIALWTCLATLSGQTTVHLRYGGPFTRKTITSIRPGTPPLITSPKHGFVNGEKIAVQGVSGMPSVNGIRIVSAATADTFEVTDLAGAPVAGQGVWENKGWAGKVQMVTLRGHPRGLLDGPDGKLTTRVKDPDGRGGRKAPAAQSGWVPWEALLRRYEALTKDPKASLNAGDVSSGWGIFGTAVTWLADQSQVRYLDAAKYWLNNLELTFSKNSYNAPSFGGCREDMPNCATDTGSFLLWSSLYLGETSMGYSVVRDQMTEGERSALANKVFNGIWNEPCQNRIRMGPGKVTTAVGSNRLQGVETQFRSIPNLAGRYLQVKDGGKPTDTWFKVISVDSDTELTLDKAPKVGAESAFWFWEADWTSNTCGALWELGHHPSMSNVVTRITSSKVQTAVGPDDTTLTIANPAAFLNQPPFHVKLGTEWMKVTGRDGNVFQVEREQFFTKRAAYKAGTLVSSTDLPISGGSGLLGYLAPEGFPNYDAVKDNKNQVFLWGMINAGLAFADDDPRARELLERGWNWWHDMSTYNSKSMWTGITQGGYSYFAFWTGLGHDLVAIGRNSFDPPIDLAAGNWLSRTHLYPIYGSLPWAPRSKVVFADSGGDDWIWSRDYRYFPLGLELFPEGPEPRYAMHFYRTGMQFWTAGEIGKPNSGHDASARWFIYTPPGTSCPSSDCLDYKTLPPYYFFTETDGQGKVSPETGYNVVVSKTDWSEKATMVWMQAMGDPGDHLGSYATPGSYRIGKAGAWLHATGPSTLDSGLVTRGSYVEVESPTSIALPASTRKNTLGTLGPLPVVDEKLGGKDVVQWRVNSNYAFQPRAAVQHHYRYFTHFKGTRDYLVVYDNVLTTSEKQKLRRIFCYTGGQGAPKASEMYKRTGLDVSCSRAEATLLSRIVLPSDAGKLLDEADVNASRPTETYSKVTTINDGSTTSSEFLVVHHAFAGTSGALPNTVALTAEEGEFRGLWLQDETPRLAMYSRTTAPQSKLTFVAAFSGEGQIVVAGLASGKYAVTRDGSPLPGEFIVKPGEGAMVFKSQGGRITIVQTGGLAALGIGTINLPSAVLGQSYGFSMDATGGVLPYQWAVSSGNLPAGLVMDASGVIAGVPDREEVAEFTVQVTDSANPPEVQRASLTMAVVKPPPETLSIFVDTILPTMVGLRYGRPNLPESQGCSVALALDQEFSSVVDEYFDSGGPTFREVSFGWNIPLLSGTMYFLRAICGDDVTMRDFETMDEESPTPAPTPEPAHSARR